MPGVVARVQPPIALPPGIESPGRRITNGKKRPVESGFPRGAGMKAIGNNGGNRMPKKI